MKSVFLVIALCLGLTAPVAADDWELLGKNETAIRFNAPSPASWIARHSALISAVG